MESQKVVAVGNTVRMPGAPFARPRAAPTRNKSIKRDSNALRESVLDVAMQIGMGLNGAVTDWVYNNSVLEDEEVSRVPQFAELYCFAFICCVWLGLSGRASIVTPSISDFGHPNISAVLWHLDHGVMIKTFNYRTYHHAVELSLCSGHGLEPNGRS